MRQIYTSLDLGSNSIKIIVAEIYKDKFTNQNIEFFNIDQNITNKFETIDLLKENMYLAYLILKKIFPNKDIINVQVYKKVLLLMLKKLLAVLEDLLVVLKKFYLLKFLRLL